MMSMFDGLRDVTLLSISLRMLLAVLCGGIIGIEREFKRRPAGFRTHILICLGAAMTTLTSQYLYLCLGQYTDMARLGAQVVAGIGFIGAGTIIVTRRQRVKGLTTAAGLWAAAIIGLTLGGGFYEGGLFATCLIMGAELIFSRIEYRILRNAPEMNLYVEYTGSNSLETLLRLLRELELKILNMGIIHSKSSEEHNACVILNLRLPKGADADDVMEHIRGSKGVVSLREL